MAPNQHWRCTICNRGTARPVGIKPPLGTDCFKTAIKDGKKTRIRVGAHHWVKEGTIYPVPRKR